MLSIFCIYFQKLKNKCQNKSQSASYTNLNIFPTKQDISTYETCHIEPNIVDGAYSSVGHYLDIQFRLLREDLYGPLREGISE